jgi:adenosylhomocysteine nucleosidase
MPRSFIVALPEEVDYQTELQGIPIHITGVGKVNAAFGVQKLIHQGFDEIINIGSCGSLRHPVGSILSIGRVFQDIDCRPLCDYGLTPDEHDSLVVEIDVASSHACFSTDYFYEQSHQSKYPPDYLGMITSSDAFDMELYPIAKACRLAGVRLQAFKWVSDDGDHSQWRENCRVALEKLLQTHRF